jgi:hypothetical protein
LLIIDSIIIEIMHFNLFRHLLDFMSLRSIQEIIFQVLRDL